MSEKPISPLRSRMIEDMTMRNFVEKTKNDDIRHVKTFAAFLGRLPDQAQPEDLRSFQVHQTDAGVRPPTINGSVAALRFLFHDHARPGGHIPPPYVRSRAAQDSGNSEPRGGSASHRGSTGPRSTRPCSPRRRRGPARVRGRGAQSHRHRQPPNADPNRAGQGPQGSLCDAVAAAPRSAARLVLHRTAQAVAVHRHRSHAALDDAPVHPRHPRRRGDGRYQEEGDAAHAPALCSLPDYVAYFQFRPSSSGKPLQSVAT